MLRSRGHPPGARSLECRFHLSIQQVSFHTHTMWRWNWGNGLYHRRRRWHGLRLCMVRLCPNTHRYTYYRVRGSHVLSLSVSVGRLVVCVFCVWACCCPHTRYSGLCCSALLAAPLHREAAARHARSIQLCRVCVRGRDPIHLVCLAHTHATTNPLQHPHTHAYEQSRMHSKGNMYM